jgi:hypothetical protein
MALLIFPSDNLPPVLKALLEPSVRLTLANDVNKAILTSQGSRTEAQIKSLIKLRQWSEQKCRETKKPIPARLSLGLDYDDEADDHDAMNGHGDADAMVH